MSGMQEKYQALLQLLDEVDPEKSSKKGMLTAAVAEVLGELVSEMEKVKSRASNIEDEIDRLSETTESIASDMEELSDVVGDLCDDVDALFSDDMEDDEDSDEEEEPEDGEDSDEDFEDGEQDWDEEDDLVSFVCPECGTVGFLSRSLLDQGDQTCPECGAKVILTEDED